MLLHVCGALREAIDDVHQKMVSVRMRFLAFDFPTTLGRMHETYFDERGLCFELSRTSYEHMLSDMFTVSGSTSTRGSDVGDAQPI